MFLIIAISGPKFGTKLVEVNRSGIEIFMAVDTSFSMLAEDIKPNRMQMAKSELMRIANDLETNKIGIIAFSGKSILQCPLTLDNNALKLFFDYIDVGIVPEPGTNIQSAIELAISNFSQKTKTNKVLIILSDGEDLENNPLESAKKAKNEGIKIWTIGFGSKTGEVIPIRDEDGKLIDYKKDDNDKIINTKLDDTLLKQIALETDGKYYYSRTGYLNVDSISNDINSIEKQKLSSKMTEQLEHRFYYFLAIAILLLLIEMFIKEN